MKAFDPDYKLLDEMYQDDYYPAFLVDRVKDELQKVIDLLESGETDTEVIQETLDEAVCGINDLQEEFDETTARSKRWPVIASALPWPTFWSGSISPLTPRRPSGKGTGDTHGEKRTGRL